MSSDEIPQSSVPSSGSPSSSGPLSSGPVVPWSSRPVVLLAFALAILWLPVVYTTGAQWTIFEQYHYGWAVPFMCLFFAWERAQRGKAKSAKQKAEITLSDSDFNISASPLSASEKSPSSGSQLSGGSWSRSPVVSWSSRPIIASSALWFLPFAFCFLFWLSRFLLEANPTWRAPAWGLVIAAAGITLALLYVAGGQTWLRRFLFPVAFFFVAVPWPTPLEDLVTQNLMRLNVAIVIELLNLFNIPALAHGNVIELSRGVVGVEEACSGIRSMQASLMIALFFGEFFRLRVLRRVGLVFGGIVFAMFFNVCRTYFLAWVCSRYGNAAVDTWHDRAGFFVLLCFIATWLLALWLARTKHGARSTERRTASGERGIDISKLRQEQCPSPAGAGEGGRRPGEGSQEKPNLLATTEVSVPDDPRSNVIPSALRPPTSDSGSAPSSSGPVVSGPFVRPATSDVSISAFQHFSFSRFAFWLITAFLLFVNLSTELWYRANDPHDIKPAEWIARWPEAASSFKTRTIPHATQAMLQCSRDSLASWEDADGHQWQGIYLRWDSSNHFYGRARASLAKGHRPDACLPAIGLTLESELPPGDTRVGDLTFHFRRYLFRTMDGQPLYVFFMVADDRLQALSTGALSLERSDRLQLALAGKRSGGQRSLEVAVTGFDSPDTAWSAFQSQLPLWISPR